MDVVAWLENTTLLSISEWQESFGQYLLTSPPALKDWTFA
jgi:hypothetical protein